MMWSSKTLPFFVAVSIASLPQGDGQSMEFTGYLTDMLCARLEIAPDQANMVQYPGNHTVGCQLLPNCLRSGYGILQDIGTNGKSGYRAGATFDESGNDFIVDILNTMDRTVNDIRVKVKGTFLGDSPAALTAEFESRDDSGGYWPALNNVPMISLDSMEFCNYQGPDAHFTKNEECSSANVLDLLTKGEEGFNSLANAKLCMREEIFILSDTAEASIVSLDGEGYIINPDGCADHATFQDVKRASAQTCSQTANPECNQSCEETDTCAAECVDGCGNPLVLPSGAVVKSCCLDACGNPLLDGCGIPFYDACGNPATGYSGETCPATNIAENQVNDCLDGCGNPLVDACGNPIASCCLDGCGNPIINACGLPWLDACGNPTSNENGDICNNLGSNVCFPTAAMDCDSCTETDTCAAECVDGCGNPLILASGAVVKTCCLDPCGNPLLNGCGLPFYDPCGNPTTGYSGEACPATNIGENQVNDCVDGCGNPFVDACGNPIDSCCLDGCGNPILDSCGIPWLDACGNPTSNANDDTCTNLGANVCLSTVECSDDVAAECASECVDRCGNPLVLSSGRTASSCCLDSCGNPILDQCGIPLYDPCGNPTLSDGTTCPASNIAENELNECVDECGNPLTDSCGSPIPSCCLDGCGNPILGPCGNPPTDPCGNPLSGVNGVFCPAGQLGGNDCAYGGGDAAWRRRILTKKTKTQRIARTKGIRTTMMLNQRKLHKSNKVMKSKPQTRKLNGHDGCHKECVDACGNPLVADSSGRLAKTCCLDSCGNPLLNGCGIPFYDACGNPTTGYSGEACLAANIGNYDHNTCIDGCGNPLVDTCGNPIESCCLDGCGNPLLDPCGLPWLDACGNPAAGEDGSRCDAKNIGENACLEASEEGGGCALGCLDACGNPLVLASGAVVKTCCLDPCGNPLLNGCGVPFYDPCGNPVTGYSGEACPATDIAENQVNDCIDGCGNPLVDTCGNPIDSCCLDGCGNPLLDPCGLPWLDACGNPSLNENGDICTNLGANVCFGSSDDDSDTCSPASLFPPSTDSVQCQGLVSPCTIAMTGANTVRDGIPSEIEIGRRRAKENKLARKMQGEPSFPAYTPLKKDLRIKVPRVPTGRQSRKELDPANDGVIGVAVNGVPIVYEHPGEGSNTLLFDSCGGHGDLANRYHYHLPPVCLLRSLGGTVPRISDWWLAPNAETQWPSKAKSTENSPLVGWAIDGNPIFGPYNPDNGELVIPTGVSGGDDECSTNTLDECNGMVLENGVYAYFITPTAPFVPPCLMGDVPTDAFVDGGLLDGIASQCPYEGTDPLAGTEICDEKTIIFQDESCPGNADRQAIRNCFELATSSFVGEPTCSQMQAAVDASAQCFLSAGCCQDLEQTVAEWRKLYPKLSLVECPLFETGCVMFGSDNVVEISAELGVGLNDLTPDTRALLRSSLASSLAVKTESVLIDSVAGNTDASLIRFHVAYETAEEAASLSPENFEKIVAAVSSDTGVQVNSLSAELATAAPGADPTDLWTSGHIVGLLASLAAVLVTLALLVFFEERSTPPKSIPEETPQP